MWRYVSKGVSSKLKLCPNSNSYSHCVTSAKKLGPVPRPGPNSIIAERAMIDGYSRIGGASVRNDEFDQNCFLKSARLFSGGFSLGHYYRGYASVAEAIVSSTDGEDDGSGVDEMREVKVYQKGFIGKERKFQPKLIRGMGPGTYHRLHQRQVQMETEAWENAAKEYKELLVDMCEQKLAPNLPYVKTLFLGWFEPLRDAILKEQDMCKLGKNKTYGPFFDVLPADLMAVITMHKLMGLLMTGGGQGGIRVVDAAHQIGEAIENEARIQMFLLKTKKKNVSNKKLAGEVDPDKKLEDEADPDKKLEGEIDPETLEQGKTVQKMRKTVEKLLKKHNVRAVKRIVKGYGDLKPWGQDNQLKVGGHLIQLMMQTAYIQPPVDQSGRVSLDIRPAFMHTLKSITKENQKITRSYGVIECDPLVRKGLEKSASHMVIPYMPMLVPPLKWNGYNKGAYLFLPSYIMRTHGAKQQRVAIKMAPRKELEPVFEALDTLGNTKWKVNKRVLAVMDRIWASGGSIADMVNREDVPLPEKPDTEDEAEQKKWRWKCKDVKKENSERHSQRCDTELKLVVARNMKDEDGFYYPHNLDFRGRAYPMHPYLNHLGSDLCRGILEFAEGRPLGKSGLRWLKIHLANVFAAGGVDKLSYDGRVAFTEEHVEDIYDSADRPLEGRRWWLSAEDPFQCLATCMNLAEALRSPSPETAISYVPVHQDGSCNGLQHYAALGRDKLGAAAVNLVAGEKPADVYSGIAARVLDILKYDSQQDPSVEPNALRAKILITQVNRKLVKQTVMTSVYGVTYIGARDQIKRRLKERCVFEDDNELFASAGYIARITLTALGEMFESAKSIMSWLSDCAKVIASENHDVRWTTPLGLPVVQPYRKLERHCVKTSLQTLSVNRETEKVMVRRQRTAFPPNFVHSLDGSHMMMTAVACKRVGLNFAGVHDSYWTHACNVDQMNKILREKFVELYNQPILENLLESFETSLPGLRFPPIPERGDFDLKEILESPYFFN